MGFIVEGFETVRKGKFTAKSLQAAKVRASKELEIGEGDWHWVGVKYATPTLKGRSYMKQLPELNKDLPVKSVIASETFIQNSTSLSYEENQ